MSKNQNHGKMKEWRRPEYQKNEDYEEVLVKQRPFVRRRTKNSANMSERSIAFPSALLVSLFRNVGLMPKEA
jgi:hypothetical protein